MNNLMLETDRLILRPLDSSDANEVFAWVSDNRVTEFMPYGTYSNIEEVVNWITTLPSKAEEYNFGFVLKENGLLIGSGCIGFHVDLGTWDFGYNIRYDYWNKGLTTEGAMGMMKFAYDNFGARDFSANHAVDNVASGKVIEKCGLTFYKYGEYSKFDGSQIFKAKYYKAHLDSI